MGAPAKYDKPEDLEAMIEMYQLNCLTNEVPMTVVGMALFLGFACRDSLYDYQTDRGEAFARVIKKGRAMVERATLEKAMKTNGAGAIFYLKNLGYSDRQHIEIETVKVYIKGNDAKL